jgi:hypothetical protein
MSELLYKIIVLKNIQLSQEPIPYACNLSYSRGRDQEDRDWKPAGQIVCKILSRKYPPKTGLAEWLKW